jgi:glycosyltransferase involved in cell wall biosynthesis
LVDGVILLTSNEGWGLSLTEALLTGKPIIANVTGGMQDQMRFVDDKGKWFIPDAEIPSNNTGRFKQHGEWAFPVYPTNRSLQGSPLTPYIWDDRCNFEDAAQQIRALYDLSPEERKAKGLKGCEWANGDEAGFTTSAMAQRIIDGIDQLFDEWEPRERFEFVKDTEIEPRVLPHKIIY